MVNECNTYCLKLVYYLNIQIHCHTVTDDDSWNCQNMSKTKKCRLFLETSIQPAASKNFWQRQTYNIVLTCSTTLLRKSSHRFLPSSVPCSNTPVAEEPVLSSDSYTSLMWDQRISSAVVKHFKRSLIDKSYTELRYTVVFWFLIYPLFLNPPLKPQTKSCTLITCYAYTVYS